MNPVQIVRIVAVLVAVVGAFWADMPQAALIMAIVGLVLGGMAVDADRRTDFLVLTLVLAAVSSAAGPIPVVGEYVSNIMANVSTIFNAGALAVIIMIIKDRLTE